MGQHKKESNKNIGKVNYRINKKFFNYFRKKRKINQRNVIHKTE